MNNRIGFKLISLIVATIFCLQGCVWKTISVNEQMRELSRKPAEIGRKYKIVLASQSSVMVYEEVKMGNEVKYEVIDVKRKVRATGADIVEDILFYRLMVFPIIVVCTFGLGLFISVYEEDLWHLGWFIRTRDERSCPGHGCPIEKTVTEHKGSTIKHENINYKDIPVYSGKVAVYINNKHRTDIPIGSDGIAKFNFGLYPVDLKGINEVKVRYRYKRAVAVTTIPCDIYTEAIKKHSLPCELKASFELSDDQGHIPNGAINAAEEVYIKAKIKNSGEGSAYGVVLVAESDNRFIKMPSRTMVGEIAPGESKKIKVAVRGHVNLPTDKVNLKLYAEEERGYGTPITLKTANQSL